MNELTKVNTEVSSTNIDDINKAVESIFTPVISQIAVDIKTLSETDNIQEGISAGIDLAKEAKIGLTNLTEVIINIVNPDEN